MMVAQGECPAQLCFVAVMHRRQQKAVGPAACDQGRADDLPAVVDAVDRRRSPAQGVRAMQVWERTPARIACSGRHRT